MKSLRERLIQYIEYKGINPKVFERTADIPNATVRRASDRMRDVTLGKISRAYPDLNINWLRTGYGEMLKDGSTSNAESSPKVTSSVLNTEKAIKFYPEVSGCMGGVEFLSNPDESFTFISLPNTSKNDYGIMAVGDSMEPKIHNGSIVILSRWEENFIEWGRIYLVVTKTGYRTIKYVFQSEKEGHITCKSENSATHPPFDIDINDICSLHIVKQWIVREYL